MRIASLTLTLCLIAALSASAQVTYTSGQGLPGMPQAAYLPTAAYPAGQAAPFASPTLINAGLLPPTPISFSGGMASDDRRGIFYTTNGQQMAMDANPLYTGFGPLSAVPAGINPIALPPLSPYVSGLCFADGPNTLWACDPFQFWPAAPLPPFAPTALPIPIPGLLNPATGLGWDPTNNTLWACDAEGFIYHFTPGGAPIGLQPVSLVPTISTPQGVAVNSTNGAGAFPAPGCSTQTAGYHVTISDGFQVYDAMNVAPPIVLPPLVAANTIYGHTYSSDFQISRCPSTVTPFAVPMAGTRRVNWDGPGVGQALRCIGATPLTSGFLIADLCPQPTCWFGLWLSPFTWSLAGITTDAAGEVTFPVGFGPPLAGIQFSFQWAIFNPPAPLGYDMSTLATVTIGNP